MVNGGTKAAERESSIIKAKTRTRDKGRGMRWKQGRGGDKQNKDNSSVGAWGGAGENKRGWRERERIMGGGGQNKKKIREENQKSKRKTYSIKNHVYFEKDDPFCWPCQLLAFQGVGFAFSILDLWERDMTGVCLAIPG